MSKRVRFEETSEEKSHKFPKFDEDKNPRFTLKNNQEEASKKRQQSSRLKITGAIDSDEENDKDSKKVTYEKMTEEDVEGAEDDYTGEEVGITPFNLKEEMEEGDFDVQGNYHFKKENIIRDEWLDNIDWMKVKKRGSIENTDNSFDDMDDGKDPDFNELEVLEKMISIMQPGETVTGALRRLGTKRGSKNKSKKREWKKEKMYDLEAKDEVENGEGSSKNSDDNICKEKLLELTGLADEMMGAGHFNVYVDSYEKFKHQIHLIEERKKASEPQIPDDADDDDALDILASSIDKNDEQAAGSSISKDTNPDDVKTNVVEDVIKWEYKWSEQDDNVYGPFNSHEMSEWQGQGYFKDGVLVRRLDRGDSQFYSSKRIDFDLYT